MHLVPAPIARRAYAGYTKYAPERTPGLDLHQGEVVSLGRLADGWRVTTRLEEQFTAKAVVLATGTFLKGRVFVGDVSYDSGPDGLFPAVGLVFSLMPEPVLGGATLLMFGTVAAAGIRIIAAQEINRKATLVMAVSFSLGLSVELVPEILCQLPETLRNIFSSGITTGGVTAILANMLIHIKE